MCLNYRVGDYHGIKQKSIKFVVYCLFVVLSFTDLPLRHTTLSFLKEPLLRERPAIKPTYINSLSTFITRASTVRSIFSSI